jgi:hypothetical protein
MNPAVVLRRTAKGSEELQTRAHALERRLRTALILLNGTSSVAEICARNGAVADLPGCLQALVDQGMAEPVPAAPEAPLPPAGFERTRQELVRIAVSLLGAEAGRVVSQLEAAPATPEGLMEAVVRSRKVVRLLIDEGKADDLVRRCRAALARLEAGPAAG